MVEAAVAVEAEVEDMVVDVVEMEIVITHPLYLDPHKQLDLYAIVQ